MDKEKELDQMRNTLDSYLKRNPIGYIENIPLFICSVLIEDGYRKADEVRKETAKEILKEVIKLFDEAVPHTREFTTLLWLVGLIKTKYGVEVDE